MLLVGCNAGGTSPAAPAASQADTSTTTTSAPPPVVTKVGRARLAAAIPNARIVIYDASGAVVPLGGDVSTDRSGFFFARAALPTRFRVEATSPGPNGPEVWSTVYDAIPGPHHLIEINAVTSLIDRYQLAHPELSLDRVKRRVRSVLRIPADRDLYEGVYSLRLSHFNQAAFLRRARKTPGGLVAYLDDLVARIDRKAAGNARGKTADSGDDSQFDLVTYAETGSTASAFGDDPNNAVINFNAMSGAWPSDVTDDGFQDVLFDDPPAVSNLASIDTEAWQLVENNVDTEATSITEDAAVNGAITDSEEAIESGVTSEVGGLLFRSLGGALAGFAFQALFSHFGLLPNPNAQVLQELSKIQGQITTLQQSVNNLSVTTFQGFQTADYITVQSGLTTLVSYVSSAWGSPIPGQQNGYSGAVAAANGSDLSTSATLLNQFVADASIAQLTQALDAISTGQLGSGTTASMMEVFRTKTTGGRFLARSLNEQLSAQYNTYAALQRQALSMLVVLLRKEVPPDLTSAQGYLKQYGDRLKRQFVRLPFPMDDDKVVYDRASGAIFYNELVGPMSVQDAITLTNSLPYVGDSQWWLCSVTDLQGLCNAAGGSSISGATPYTGYLQQLGIDLSALPSGAHNILTVEPQGILVDGFPPLNGYTATVNTTSLNDLSTTWVGNLRTTDDLSKFVGYFILTSSAPTFVDSPGQWMAYYGCYDGLGNQMMAVQVSQDGTQCRATTSWPSYLGTEAYPVPIYDISSYVYWESSNPAIAQISNVPGSEGQITRLGSAPAGTVTFTATRRELNAAAKPVSIGGNGLIPTGSVSATVTYTYAAAPPATLTSIYLCPRMTTQSVPMNNVQLTVLGQFSDGSAEELTADPVLGAQITYSSSDPAVVVTPQTSGGVTVAGPVYANAAVHPASTLVTLTATVNGLTSSTTMSFP